MIHNVRAYVRTNYWSVEAKVSLDQETWTEVQVPDISAGGLQFLSHDTISEGQSVWFDLSINPLMREVPDMVYVEAKGVVKRAIGANNRVRTYGVEFTEITENERIRLDVLINRTIEKFGRIVLMD